MTTVSKLEPARIDRWLSEWGSAWGVPGLAASIEVSIGRRLRSSLGRCHPRSGKIRIHPALLAESEALLREVLCHEAAHVAAFRLHGHGPRPHGAEWAALMRLAGYDARARVDLQSLSPGLREALSPRFLYQHSCVACGVSRTARRAVRGWRCRRCRDAGREGRLEIRKIAHSTSSGATPPRPTGTAAPPSRAIRATGSRP